MTLNTAIAQRYPKPGEHGDCLRRVVEEACRGFLDLDLGDDNAEQRLTSTDNDCYWQQLSEVLIARELQAVGLQPQHLATGPDFLIEYEGRRVWIEVICPSAAGLPSSWTNLQINSVFSLPHEAILLRWTAAIKEKAEKLLGNPEREQRGYLEKDIVLPDDAYVIAVNGRLLRGGDCFPQLEGISGCPFAVEATFSVGPMQVHLDRETLRTTGSDHQHRPKIPKPSGATVPAGTFFDTRFGAISAVWALDVNENLLLGLQCPMAVVHNPLADNPLPQGVLPAQSEYVAEDRANHYLLSRIHGRYQQENR